MNKLLLGILAGIGIGLLIAPDKGSATLSNLKRRFREYTDDATDEAEELFNKGKKAYARAEDSINEE